LSQRQRLAGSLAGDSFAPFAGHYTVSATSDDPNWLIAVAGLHLDGYDAGPRDAGIPDAGTQDAGTPDAGAHDAGRSDAGTTDGGTSGSRDAGPWAPRLESVGCACQSADGAGLLLAVLALSRGRRGSRRTRASRPPGCAARS
jgi:MYXO-CTERM domain-containing protein